MQQNVTVIIPVRNGAATIERAVISALDSGADDVFIFDDNSVDSTPYILKDLQGMCPAIQLFGFNGEVRCGVSFARNYLIEQVPDGLIVCLDADDELTPDAIPTLSANWQPDTWVYGDYVEVENGKESTISGAPAGTLPRKNITGVTFAFHKNDWSRAGGFDPDFAVLEDYAFQCALTHVGIKPNYIPSVIYRRYLHPQGNPRTARAQAYWDFYHRMAREKYPNAFNPP